LLGEVRKLGINSGICACMKRNRGLLG
jgi:hypothetical protein